MYISSNYAQIRCDKCNKVIHIMPDDPFKAIECDCKEDKPKTNRRQVNEPKSRKVSQEVQ